MAGQVLGSGIAAYPSIKLVGLDKDIKRINRITDRLNNTPSSHLSKPEAKLVKKLKNTRKLLKKRLGAKIAIASLGIAGAGTATGAVTKKVFE